MLSPQTRRYGTSWAHTLRVPSHTAPTPAGLSYLPHTPRLAAAYTQHLADADAAVCYSTPASTNYPELWTSRGVAVRTQ